MRESGARLDAVLFDYGHTLIHFDERPHSTLLSAYEKINHLLARTLSREVPAAEILIERVSMAVDDAIQRDYALGREEEVEIAAIYDAALRALGLELEPDVIEQVMEMEQDGWLNSVHVGPDVVETLEWLRSAGLRLGIVSNAAYRPALMQRQVSALQLAGYFDGLTFSSAVGVRKPHPRIYQDALGRLGVSPSATLFVGDRVKEDVRGPQSLGMRAALLREWRKEEDPQVADFVIDRLGELRPIVERLLVNPGRTGTYNEVASPE
ncbi:MAG TPA: HAD family hydrolase [Candidatus Dormibacteraeota bacterium]